IHPSYGRQFTVESYEVLPPVTRQGIQRYLGSGLIKGIGPVTAEKIVKKFGFPPWRSSKKPRKDSKRWKGLAPRRRRRLSTAGRARTVGAGAWSSCAVWGPHRPWRGRSTVTTGRDQWNLPGSTATVWLRAFLGSVSGRPTGPRV